MPMETYAFPARNGEPMQGARCTETRLHVCPVCGGAVLPTPPYAPETGTPSMEWCPECDTQFGWDDAIASDAPPGTLTETWERLRHRWRV